MFSIGGIFLCGNFFNFSQVLEWGSFSKVADVADNRVVFSEDPEVVWDIIKDNGEVDFVGVFFVFHDAELRGLVGVPYSTPVVFNGIFNVPYFLVVQQIHKVRQENRNDGHHEDEPHFTISCPVRETGVDSYSNGGKCEWNKRNFHESTDGGDDIQSVAFLLQRFVKSNVLVKCCPKN